MDVCIDCGKILLDDMDVIECDCCGELLCEDCGVTTFYKDGSYEVVCSRCAEKEQY